MGQTSADEAPPTLRSTIFSISKSATCASHACPGIKVADDSDAALSSRPRNISGQSLILQQIMTTAVATNIRPLGDRIVVRAVEEEEQVRGGIIIPDSAKEKPQEAEVVAVGNGRRNDDGKVIPLEVKVGDRVIISKYGGTEVKIDGESFTILRESDVLGILS
jgi:chaperonin GroES